MRKGDVFYSMKEWCSHQREFRALLMKFTLCIAPLFIAVTFWTGAYAECPDPEPQLQNYTGTDQAVCPCFVTGEEAGAVFDLPPEYFPIKILKVGIAWGSAYGGAPDSLEQAIHFYAAGLPSPGAPIFSLYGPVLSDGYINEFDLEPLPEEVIFDSGPFSVTLEFYNENAGDPFAPSTIHDNNGCQSGKNLVYAIPGGWYNACTLGITGDWLFYVIYCFASGSSVGVGRIPDGDIVPGTPLTVQNFSGNLLMSWGASCVVEDTDYEVYEGSIGNFTSHVFKLCSTGGSTAAIVSPGTGDKYYLVVPSNSTNEGSYGSDSLGVERSIGTTQCIPQIIQACP